MTVVARISGTAQLGGNVSSYTAYKIEVNCAGGNWAIYRRYKQFSLLFEELKTEFGEDYMETSGITIPDKAIGSSFSFVVSKRMTDLQAFLDKILSIEGIESQSSFQTFFDTTGQGLSGAAKDLGLNHILLETFALVKPCKNLVEMWQSCYVVLSKSGTVFVLKNLYDSISRPLVSFPLTNGEVRVNSPSGTRKVDMVCPSTSMRLVIKLSSEAQLASWLRSIGDFTTRQSSAFDTPKKSAPSPAPASAPSSRPTQESSSLSVHSKGTGHTDDELSAMYGV